MAKKETKRSRVKYPGLKPEVNSKLRWEYMDQDYIDKLSDKEKQWLSNFMEEFVGANMHHKGKKFHKTKKERKTCYDRNNARNRDLYAISRTKGWLDNNTKDAIEQHQEKTNQEDVIIEILDQAVQASKKSEKP